MFTSQFIDQGSSTNAFNKARQSSDPYAYMSAVSLFEQARRSAAWKKMENWLFGKRPSMLMDLEDVKRQIHAISAHYHGVREVPLSQICGTQGRVNDFDVDFRPQSSRIKERWLSIATAWYQGFGLPAVELVKIGEIYFVVDGNHRVSVAKAMGKKDIDAIVIEYQVTGPLPWQKTGCNLTTQLAVA